MVHQWVAKMNMLRYKVRYKECYGKGVGGGGDFMRMFTVITINYVILIMLSILSKNSVDEILKYFSYFSKKKGLTL